MMMTDGEREPIITWHADESSAPHDRPDPPEQEEPHCTNLKTSHPKVDAEAGHLAGAIHSGVPAAEHEETSQDRSYSNETKKRELSLCISFGSSLL